MRDYEIKTCNRVELKTKNDMEFEGYASIFHNKDSYDDIMMPGAFSKTIQENRNRIKVLMQHDSYSIVGLPTELYEDSRGLYFRAKISDTMLGRDLNTLIKDKVITEMSIGYNTIKYNMNEDLGTRELLEVRLWEISPVTWGANSLAAIKKLGIAKNDKYDILLEEIEKLKRDLKALGNNKPIESLIIDSKSQTKNNDSQMQSLLEEIRKLNR